MDATLKSKWLAALRSGDYKQGEGALCDGEAKPSYCCLGVLAIVAGGQFVKDEDAGGEIMVLRGLGLEPEAADGDGTLIYLCRKGKSALGLTYETQRKLGAMNDGTYDSESQRNWEKKDFPEIADWIEENIPAEAAAPAAAAGGQDHGG